MGEKRDCLILLQRAKQEMEHINSAREKGNYVSDRELREDIESAISSLKTVDRIITGEGKRRK